MSKKTRRHKAKTHRLRGKAATWIALVILALCSLSVVWGILLDNARRMGNEMAQSFSLQREREMAVYETLMAVCTSYMDYQTASNQNPDVWVEEYLKIISGILGENVIDPYAVIDGEIIAADAWEGDADYAAEETQWYQRAEAAQGGIIYTDGYQDAITGELVITIAQKSKRSGNITAFDIFPEQFGKNIEDNNLPEGSSYMLCDSNGTVLCRYCAANVSEEEFQMYADKILKQIKNGDTEPLVYEIRGEKRAAYFETAKNGWISIVSMPYFSLMKGVRTLALWYAGVLAAFFAMLVVMDVRERKINKSFQRTNDTVRVLGNSYYAIYRVDFSKNTYDMIKGSDYVRQKLPDHGNYERLMDTAGEVIQPEAYEEYQKSFSIENIRQMVQRRVRDFGGDFQRKFGEEYRWVNVRMMFDESLNPDEAVLCFREVEEEKKARLKQIELLRESLSAAKKSEESKNAFFSNMSHDMRTPLNAIIGLTELMEKEMGDEKKLRGHLGKIRYSSRILLNLINDILEMSRLENGKITLDSRHFDLNRCIEECTDLFAAEAEKQGKTFEVEINIQTKEVYGDAFRLTQILNNLLSNAVKFTSAGDAISVQVKELEQKEYTRYQITVKDTGVGMSKEFLDKIFIPYERETRFGAQNVAGTGLGMPIAKNILSQMNGEMTVESTLGEGSTFTVTLPFKGVEKKEEAAWEKTKKEQTAQEFLKGKKILLAEDNEINMEIACELLRMYGAEVEKAWNGREAAETFRISKEYEFDAVLMDVQMPEMDGCEAAAAIRIMRRADAKTVPIIAVTANAFAEDLSATQAAGMNAHISKPIDFQLLGKILLELT